MQVPLAEAWEIVTTRETEFDDWQRDRLLALAVYEAGVCQCGWHTSLTTDPDVDFALKFGQPCQVCAATAKYGRILGESDTKVRKQIGKNPAAPDPADGRRLSVQLKL